MNQSKLEANTCSWHEARENVRERVTIAFVLLLIGWESGARFLSQSLSKVCKTKANAIYFRHSSEKRSQTLHNKKHNSYPRLLGNNCWFAIFRKVFRPIMHDGSVIVRCSKWINWVVFFKVVLISCITNEINKQSVVQLRLNLTLFKTRIEFFSLTKKKTANDFFNFGENRMISELNLLLKN